MRWLVVLTSFFAFYSQNAVPREMHKLVVAIVDTGLDLQDPRFTRFLCSQKLHRDFTGEGLEDKNSHGTHVAGLVVHKNDPQKFCIVIVKVFDAEGKQQNDSYERGLYYLRRLHPDVVNMSLSGGYFNEQEALLVRENPLAKFVVAAGNDNLDLAKYNRFPASLSRSYPNVTTVGALTSKGLKLSSSNYGLPRMKWFLGGEVLSTVPGGMNAYMSGTSQATGNATNSLIRGYDRATDSFSYLPPLEESI